jgi:hypothetical protein
MIVKYVGAGLDCNIPVCIGAVLYDATGQMALKMQNSL